MVVEEESDGAVECAETARDGVVWGAQLMGADLDPKPLYGVGPEARLIDAKLFDETGALRDFGALSEEIGDMQAFLGLWEMHLREQLRRPRARGYPPRIFISYRRESPSDIAWCVDAAQRLDALGYDVILDERRLRRPVRGEEDFHELAEFLGLLADSDVALVILTGGYLSHEGKPNSMRNWIFEEWSRIKTLEDWGLLEVVVVHRGGDLDDLWGGIGALEAYIDARNDEGADSVAEFFGPYRGLKVSESDRDRLGIRAGEVLVAQRNEDRDSARRALDEIADLAGTDEYRAAEAHALAATGDPEAARDVAVDLLKRNPTIPVGCEVATLLWVLDFNREAFPGMVELAEGPSLWRSELHWRMGDILDSAGLVHSAVNQYHWCLVHHEDETLGGLTSRMPAEIERMCRHRLEGLMHVLGEPDIGATICSACQAAFQPGWKACVYCGTTHPGGEACGMCLGDPPLMEDLSRLDFCPVCRRAPDGNGGWNNMYIVPREPKGRWSVLAPS